VPALGLSELIGSVLGLRHDRFKRTTGLLHLKAAYFRQMKEVFTNFCAFRSFPPVRIRCRPDF